MKSCARILAPLYCWLLIMPLGWCCWLVPAIVHAEEEASEVACGCCCNRQENAPAKPKDTPEVPPCCCKPVPAAFLTLPDDADLAVPVAPVVLVEVLVGGPPSCSTPAVVAVDSSPPLHILHCLWLC